MHETELFRNREEAGALLARRLSDYSGHPDAIVLALPRGGVLVGFAMARALDLPLDVLIVRKLGAPGHEEFAMGAVAHGGVCVLQPGHRYFPPEAVEAAKQREFREVELRERRFRGNRPGLGLAGKVAIIVDDGVATGSTMLAAIEAARRCKAARIVAAAPVASLDALRGISPKVEEIVFLRTPEPFYAVGRWYENFGQTSDEEVIALLDKAAFSKAPDLARRTP